MSKDRSANLNDGMQKLYRKEDHSGMNSKISINRYPPNLNQASYQSHANIGTTQQKLISSTNMFATKETPRRLNDDLMENGGLVGSDMLNNI